MKVIKFASDITEQMAREQLHQGVISMEDMISSATTEASAIHHSSEQVGSSSSRQNEQLEEVQAAIEQISGSMEHIATETRDAVRTWKTSPAPPGASPSSRCNCGTRPSLSEKRIPTTSPQTRLSVWSR